MQPQRVHSTLVLPRGLVSDRQEWADAGLVQGNLGTTVDMGGLRWTGDLTGTGCPEQPGPRRATDVDKPDALRRRRSTSWDEARPYTWTRRPLDKMALAAQR